jgi:hypothetical protein
VTTPTVRVNLRATERVSYARTFDMPADDYSEYENAVSAGVGDLWLSQFADRFLDPLTHVVGGGEYEDVECDLVK